MVHVNQPEAIRAKDAWRHARFIAGSSRTTNWRTMAVLNRAGWTIPPIQTAMSSPAPTSLMGPFKSNTDQHEDHDEGSV